MVISLAEATNTLLSGKPLAWQKFREHRAGSITLSKPAQRRLFAFLLKQDSAKVAQGSEELFSGIVSAWADSDDPAETETALPVEADTQAWRLERIEANGFGGLTLHGGERFEFWTEGDNWCLLGQNGSGKTSLASAILWALTGKRIREQDGPVDEIGQRAPVYAPSGKRIGDWPPLASYPTSPAELLAPADVWVRLTFKSPSGALATAFRKIVSNPDGSATTEVNVDPRLLSAPQLIETGLLMPARIARIGFGEKSQSLYDAVKLLTGLDQLSDIADGCLQFTHAGRRFLRYGKDHGLEGYAARFKENIERARAKANDLAFALPAELEIAVPGIGGALRKAAQEASSDAAAHLQALKSEIGPTVDIATQQGRTRIRTALNTAFGLLSQPISAIAPFNAWVSLKEANDTQQFSQLSKAIAAAESALETALRWHARQNEDHKFRLKALASRFYVPAHTHDEATYCPLCEGMLTTDQQRDLALQLATLKEDAAEAERRLEEVCLSLESQLTTNIPPAISRHVDVLKDMNPRDAYLAAIRERFCLSSPFKDTFSGLATATEAVVTTQYASLPHFEYPAFQPAPGEPAAATALRRNIHVYSRLIALATWWMTNRQAFRDALTSLLGQPDTRGNFASESLHGRLISIELALLKSEPLDELAKFLSAAADAAEAWAPANAEQKRREEIAEALEPLKDLRFLVAAETAGSIERLSDRIKAILTRIHYQERLSYEQTSIAKRTVTVEGSFASGMQIDAAHVANSSWLRAILWAFVLALREETIAVLGRNPFPLMVLDDPQITFDPRNKLKWAEEIARLANLDATLPESSQLFLTTHERHFYQCMVDHQSLKGKQGLIGGVNKASGVAKIVNGGCLERVFHEASENNDDARARDYISDVRIYCEDLLKCVLRGEGPAIPSLTLGKLAKELKRLHDSRTPPFDRTPFKKLLDTLSGGGGKEIKLINESHHKDDETIGPAQAKEVKAFWEQKLRAQIHDAFELYDNFSSFYGEPRSFPWAKNVVAFPTGARDAIGAAKLQHTGIAAAAKTDGMAGDGIVTVEEWDSGPSVVLPNHEAYQLAAGTLDPVASVGDILIVCNHARVHPRNLVVARVGDALLARRFNTVEAHPGLAVLTGQSVDPAALAEPILIAPTTENCRKIVGTLFVGSTFGIPAAAPKHEIVPVKNPASLTALLDGTRLFQVKGRSAEPIALDGQFLITRKVSASDADLKALDGRLVVAVDENGTRYFKRLRYRSDLIVLESLNPDGTTSAEILSHNGALNLPRLTNAIEVVGVLFELPTH